MFRTSKLIWKFSRRYKETQIQNIPFAFQIPHNATVETNQAQPHKQINFHIEEPSDILSKKVNEKANKQNLTSASFGHESMKSGKDKKERVSEILNKIREEEDPLRELAGKIKKVDLDKNNMSMHNTIEEKYNERVKRVLQTSHKIKRFQDYEYFRGEDLVEKVPYNDYYTLRIQDVINKLKVDDEIKRNLLEMPNEKHQLKAQVMREKVSAYHEKQKKYELEEFNKYLQEYPGTINGNSKEEDWDAYMKYALKKMPKYLLDKMSEKEKIKQIDNVDEQDGLKPMAREYTIGSLSKYNIDEAKDHSRDSKVLEDQKYETLIENCEEDPVTVDIKSEIPIFPEIVFTDYQNYMKQFMGWLNFRKYFYNKHSQSLLNKTFDTLNLIQSSKQAERVQYYDLPSNIPSLWRYYKCLPQHIQEDPGMKDIYLGLEYSSPDFTYQEKEDALNYAAKELLPLDPASDHALDQFISTKKEGITPYLMDKIFTVNPQFTWDIDEFLDEVRSQELKGLSSTLNKDQKFPQPPAAHLMWEEGVANLPVDFYDNQDGFWNDHISHKLKRYDACKPMLKVRRYLKH